MSAEPNIQSDLSESARAAFTDAYLKHLAPENPVEETLAIEIVAAAWRLRRCGIVEAQFPGSDNTEALQRSVDQARNQAHRLFVKSVAELGKLQTERQFRFELKLENDETLVSYRDIIRDLSVQASWDLKKRRLESVASVEQIIERAVAPPAAAAPAPAQTDGLKTTANWLRFVNSPAAPQPAPDSTGRNAPCPCKSGQKYKRCCGRTAAGHINTPSPEAQTRRASR